MLALYLMTRKGHAVLEALVDNGYANHIDRVIGARDSKVQADYFEEIRRLCAQAGIEFAERNRAATPPSAWSLAISWRWLLGVNNLIVLHDSLLPRYRGFAPLVSALVNGDAQVGVTALLATSEFDQGDIVAQKTMTVEYPAKIADVTERISRLYALLALEIAGQLRASQALTLTPQDHACATYSLWRDDDDYRVDWSDSAERIERFVNAVGFPYNGASTSIGEERLRIWDVEATEDVVIENRVPGKVLFLRDGCPIVVCGSGLLKITRMTNVAGESVLPFATVRVRFK
jgi:methionyl-tRNA formyltransferase